jgi:hypothetical protein
VSTDVAGAAKTAPVKPRTNTATPMIPQRDIALSFPVFSQKSTKTIKVRKTGGVPRVCTPMCQMLLMPAQSPPEFPDEIPLTPELRHVFE